MKRVIVLAAVFLAVVDRPVRAGNAALPSDFFDALRLPPLTTQQDRFQIYDAPNEESLLHNLENNRPDEFGILATSLGQGRPMLPGLPGGAERDLGQIKVRQEATLPLTTVKTKLDVPDVYDQTSPQVKKAWTADEQVRLFLPEAEAFFLFGQVKSGGDLVQQTNTDFTGKTGVGVKWSPLPATELQLRTGRQLVVSDFSTASAASLDRSQFLVEVLAKMPVPLPLFDGVALEYTGSAISGVTSTDRSIFKQDLRINFPAGKMNEFYLGVRYKNDPNNATRPDTSELYTGFTFKY